MPTKTHCFKLDPRDPDLSVLRQVARGCREGKIVAFPTETVYGIGGSMSMPSVSRRLAEIKGRDSQLKPFSLHIGDYAMVDLLGVERTSVFRYLTDRFWPGPLTLLVKDKHGNKLGLRYPKSRLVTSLINTVGEPMVATSANRTGEASPKDAEDVLRSLDGEVDYLIDGGPCEHGEDSTILDLTGDEPVMIREGAMANEIRGAMDEIKKGASKTKNILIVCTGNSCRSPMAEGWLKDELRKQGLSDKISVSSAGIMAGGGRTSTPEAVLVMKNRGVDISDHKSQACTREDVMKSDLVIVMSEEHHQFITGMIPEAKSKIWILDIPDPIGMGILIYEEVVKSIERKLKAKWDFITRID